MGATHERRQAVSVRIIHADVLAGLADLEDESVHCIVARDSIGNDAPLFADVQVQAGAQ